MRRPSPKARRRLFLIIREEKAQATTEFALLLPLFFFFVFAFAKVFALLILVQKLEIGSFYAARRWQLESHRNVQWVTQYDQGILLGDINDKTCSYLGYTGGGPAGCTSPTKKASVFMDLTSECKKSQTCPAGTPGVTVTPTQVWNVVTVTACTGAPLENNPFFQSSGFVLCSTKYVPNRDRPIAFVLPGLSGAP